MDIGIFEGGAIAVCLGLVGTMWGFLQKLVSSKLREQYEIIVKLIHTNPRVHLHMMKVL